MVFCSVESASLSEKSVAYVKLFTPDTGWRKRLKSEADTVLDGIEFGNIRKIEDALDRAAELIRQYHVEEEEIRHFVRYILGYIDIWAQGVEIPQQAYITDEQQRRFYETVTGVRDLVFTHTMLMEICRNFCLVFVQMVSSRDNHCIQVIKMYIDRHCMESISLTKMRSLFYRDLSQLSRQFKQETGINYSNYIAKKKMKKAGELLMETDLKISAIAHMLSYSDEKYFRKLFKQEYGETASDFRKQYHKNKETGLEF